MIRFAAKSLFVLALWLISTIVHGQQASSIKARIVDAKTNVPVPFASVKFVGHKGMIDGVISNGDGGFQIPLRYKEAIDSIVISCIGYTTRLVTRKELDDTRTNLIRLDPTPVQLVEAEVTARKERLPARKIVRSAIESIPNNFSQRPFSYVGYYRDYQLEKNQYVNLNEAIVEVFDDGFATSDLDSTRIKLYQYHKNENFARDSSTEIAYDNRDNKFIPTAKVMAFSKNELALLRIHDAIRNYDAITYSFVNEFRRNFVDNHAFKLAGTVYLNEIQLYKITFQSLYTISGTQHLAQGEIYIEKRDFAIHKMSYSVYHKEPAGNDLLYDIQLEYKRVDSLMYLNYISFNNHFLANTGEGFKVEDVLYDRARRVFIVKFNRPPEAKSALERRKYDFTYEGQKLFIRGVGLSPKNANEVEVSMEDDAINSQLARVNMLKNVRFHIHGIKDQAGREINKDMFKAVNQYRELFVQLLNPQSDRPSRGKFISFESALNGQPIDASKSDVTKYWMNTPLKEDQPTLK